MNEYLGYSLFKDIQNPTLRARNRFVVSQNIREEFGFAMSKDYLRKFNKKDLIAIYVVGQEMCSA